MQQEFRLGKGWRIFKYVASPAMIALGLFVAFMSFFASPVEWTLVLILLPIGLGLTAMMLYGLLETIRSKVLVFDGKVQQIGVFRNKELKLSQIKGFKVSQNYIHLVPHHPQLPDIKFSIYYGNRHQLSQWLTANFSDLDEAEQLTEVHEILSKEAFGWNEEQRAHRLHSARKVAKTLNISGTVTGLWLFFYPNPYEALAAINLVFPLLVIGALHYYKGLVRLDEKQNSIYPSLFLALLMPSLGLIMRGALEFDVLEYKSLLAPVLLLAAFLTGMLLWSTKEFNYRKLRDVFAVVSIGFFMAGFAYGASVHVNCWYDASVPAHFQTEILGKRISKSKRTTYNLELAAWGPRQEIQEVSVSASLYEQLEVGGTVNVYLKPGLLQVPWFFVTQP